VSSAVSICHCWSTVTRPTVRRSTAAVQVLHRRTERRRSRPTTPPRTVPAQPRVQSNTMSARRAIRTVSTKSVSALHPISTSGNERVVASGARRQSASSISPTSATVISLVAVLVVPRQTSHSLLDITCRRLVEKHRCLATSKDRRDPPVMADHDLAIAPLLERESAWPRHESSVALAVGARYQHVLDAAANVLGPPIRFACLSVTDAWQ